MSHQLVQAVPMFGIRPTKRNTVAAKLICIIKYPDINPSAIGYDASHAISINNGILELIKVIPEIDATYSIGIDRSR